MAEKKLIPVQGVDTAGIIRDIPAHALPPQAWSDGRNIRFKDGTVRKREGTVQAFSALPNTVRGADTNVLTTGFEEYASLAYWPAPQEDDRRYVEVVLDTSVPASPTYRLYTVDDQDNRVDITPNAAAAGLPANGIPQQIRQTSPTTFAYNIENGDWNSSLFQGGYDIILNNGYHAPAYIDPTMSNLLPLPGWNYDDDRFVSARVVRAVGNRLIAGNFVHRLRTDLNDSQDFPGTVRISTLAPAGELPTTWEPLDTNTADEFDLSNTAAIQDIVPLQGQAIIYTNDSIHSLTFQGDNAVVRTVAEGYGALTTNAIIEFDGGHLVVGSDDIYIFGGHPGSIQSVADGKIRDFFFDDISPLTSSNLFIVRDRGIDEIQIFYPSTLSVDGSCDRYIAWNYRNNTWSINDTPGVENNEGGAVAGVVGPIRGGGIVSGTIPFSGYPNTIQAEQTEQQNVTVTVTDDFAPAAAEIQSFAYANVDDTSTDPLLASTFTDEQFTIGVRDDVVPGSAEHFDITFPANFNTGTPNRNIGTQTGTPNGVAGNSPPAAVNAASVTAITNGFAYNNIGTTGADLSITATATADINIGDNFFIDFDTTGEAVNGTTPPDAFAGASGTITVGGNTIPLQTNATFTGNGQAFMANTEGYYLWRTTGVAAIWALIYAGVGEIFTSGVSYSTATQTATPLGSGTDFLSNTNGYTLTGTTGRAPNAATGTFAAQRPGGRTFEYTVSGADVATVATPAATDVVWRTNNDTASAPPDGLHIRFPVTGLPQGNYTVGPGQGGLAPDDATITVGATGNVSINYTGMNAHFPAFITLTGTSGAANGQRVIIQRLGRTTFQTVGTVIRSNYNFRIRGFTRTSTTYTLNSVAAADNLTLVLGGTGTPTANTGATTAATRTFTGNGSLTFNDTTTNRPWTLTGTVPVNPHSGTTAANGTLPAAAGTASPTNISGFTGLDLTVNPTNVSLGAAGAAVTIIGTSDGPMNPFVGAGFNIRSIGGTVNGRALTTSDNWISGVGGQTYLTVATAGLYCVLSVTTFSTSWNLFRANAGETLATNTGIAGVTLATRIAAGFNTNPRIAGGVMDMLDVNDPGTDPAVTYTLTNGSTTAFTNVTATVGGTPLRPAGTTTGATFPLAAAGTLSVTFNDAGSARAWSVSLGQADQWRLQSTVAATLFDTGTLNFPGGRNNNQAALDTFNFLRAATLPDNVSIPAQPSPNVVRVQTDGATLPAWTFTPTRNTGTGTLPSAAITSAQGLTPTGWTWTVEPFDSTTPAFALPNRGSLPVVAGTTGIAITATGGITGTTAAPSSTATSTQIADAIAAAIVAVASPLNGTDVDWTTGTTTMVPGMDGNPDRTASIVDVNNGGRDYVLMIMSNTDGINTDITGVHLTTDDTLSGHQPDSITLCSPDRLANIMVTAGSGETATAFLDRIVTAVNGDANHTWTAAHTDATNTLSLTNAVGGLQTVAWQLDHNREATIVAPDVPGNFEFSGAAGQMPSPPNSALAALVATPGGEATEVVTLMDPDRTSTATQAIAIGGIPGATNARQAEVAAREIAIAIEAGTVFADGWVISNDANSNVINFEQAVADWVPLELSTPVDGFFRDTEFANRNWRGTNPDDRLTLTATSVRQGHPAILGSVVTVSFTDSRDRTVNLVSEPLPSGSTFASETLAAQAVAQQVSTLMDQVPPLSAEVIDDAAGNPTIVEFETQDFGQGNLNLSVTFDPQTDQANQNSYRRRGDTTARNARTMAVEFTAPVLTPRRNPVDNEALAPFETTESSTNDPLRPWRINAFNFAQEFVMIANGAPRDTVGDPIRTPRTRAASIQGYRFGFYNLAAPISTVGNTAAIVGDPYESYVERIHNPMDGEVEATKSAESVQLLLSDGDVDVQLGMTDSPGDLRDLYVDENGVDVVTRTFFREDDYKVDWRRHGRLFNLRISDPTRVPDGDTDRAKVDTDPETGWRVAGYGLSVGKEENRGGRRS